MAFNGFVQYLFTNISSRKYQLEKKMIPTLFLVFHLFGTTEGMARHKQQKYSIAFYYTYLLIHI